MSPRTVRRDVDRLRELGYRVEAARGPAGGYRLEAGSDLPPLLFDDEQAIAVALALAVAPASGADIAEAATRALATIRQVMPSRLRGRVDAVAVTPTTAGTAVDPDVLVAVSEATRAHEVLRFDYGAAWGEAADRPARRVEPHAVVARNGRWYLLAWNDEAGEAGDWSTYRIDRMHPRAPTRLRFVPREIPGGDPVAFLAARFRGSNVDAGSGSAATSGWPCVGTVEIAAPARRIAPFVGADSGGGSGSGGAGGTGASAGGDADTVLVEVDEHTSRLTLGSWSWRALAARFAGLDADFRILEPAELRAAARELGARVTSASD